MLPSIGKPRQNHGVVLQLPRCCQIRPAVYDSTYLIEMALWPGHTPRKLGPLAYEVYSVAN